MIKLRFAKLLAFPSLITTSCFHCVFKNHSSGWIETRPQGSMTSEEVPEIIQASDDGDSEQAVSAKVVRSGWILAILSRTEPTGFLDTFDVLRETVIRDDSF